MRPGRAVLFAATCNTLGPLIFAPAVAHLIASGLVDPSLMTPSILMVALVTTLAFAALGHRIGLSLNTMHTVLGAMLGASVAAQGFSGLEWFGALVTLAALALAPIAAWICATLLWILIARALQGRAPIPMERAFRKTQWLACGLFNLGRGHLLAQTGLGLIWLALIVAGLVQASKVEPPLALAGLLGLTVGAGTIAGGLAMIRSRRIWVARLRPAQACTADGAAALILATASQWGVPVASPHTQMAATIGASQPGRLSLRRWRVDARTVAAALFSLPGAALAGALLWQGAQIWAQ
jgi:PiT family inorganic phosphate transporter